MMYNRWCYMIVLSSVWRCSIDYGTNREQVEDIHDGSIKSFDHHKQQQIGNYRKQQRKFHIQDGSVINIINTKDSHFLQTHLLVVIHTLICSCFKLISPCSKLNYTRTKLTEGIMFFFLILFKFYCLFDVVVTIIQLDLFCESWFFNI